MTTARTRKTTEAPPDGDGHLPVDGKAMRQLHALLTAHGIPTADKGRHDYLSAEVGRPIASASELTRTETARLIATLEAEDAPEVHTLTSRSLRKLREPFPDEAIGKLPRSTCQACSKSDRKRCEAHSWVSRCGECGSSHSSAMIHLDYVGHADVTDRLLQVDPSWTWEPMVKDPNGNPSLALSYIGGELWINLTVCGVTRPGVGDGKTSKERVGDALRNAAMRFGVALDLWAKGDREWAHTEKTDPGERHADEAPPPQDQPTTPWQGPSVEQSIARLRELAERQGTDLDGITAKFRSDLGVDSLTAVPAPALAAFVLSVEAYIARKQREQELAGAALRERGIDVRAG